MNVELEVAIVNGIVALLVVYVANRQWVARREHHHATGALLTELRNVRIALVTLIERGDAEHRDDQ